jgi:hypothetical protein
VEVEVEGSSPGNRFIPWRGSSLATTVGLQQHTGKGSDLMTSAISGTINEELLSGPVESIHYPGGKS